MNESPNAYALLKINSLWRERNWKTARWNKKKKNIILQLCDINLCFSLSYYSIAVTCTRCMLIRICQLPFCYSAYTCSHLLRLFLLFHHHHHLHCLVLRVPLLKSVGMSQFQDDKNVLPLSLSFIEFFCCPSS